MSRVYAVTGVASGIGKATRELLEARGDRVIGIDLHDAEILLDLGIASQRAQLASLVEQAAGGSIDAIIAVAGVAAPVPSGAQVNFFGARDTLLELRPLLLASTTPRAVVVSSISVVHPHHQGLTEALCSGNEEEAMRIAEELAANGQGGYIYTSSKRAIAQWVRQRAVTSDWAGAGIALNTAAPGSIVTALTKPLLATAEGRAKLAETVPMPLNGVARPEAVAHLLDWLTSPENSHVTGQTIFIDGGAEATLRGPLVFGGAAPRSNLHDH